MMTRKPSKGELQVGGIACVFVLLATLLSRDLNAEGLLAVGVTYLVLQVIFRMMLRSARIRQRPLNFFFIS